jgi:hypothetical protein
MSESRRSVVKYDENARYLGYQPRKCGEHQIEDSSKAWCHDCGMWCYPKLPCHGCENAILDGW